MTPRAKFRPDAVTPLIVAMLIAAVTVVTIGIAPYVALIVKVVR